MCLSNANAGGLAFDPSNCPQGEWFPDVQIPQMVTDTVCKFFVALDHNDISAAYQMLSPEFTNDQPREKFVTNFQYVFQNNNELQNNNNNNNTILLGPQQRYITNVESRRDVYIFTFQILGPKEYGLDYLPFQENIYVKLDADKAQIAGLRLGPY